jgi:hypothetical protein
VSSERKARLNELDRRIDQVYSIAVHDVRRMIETLRPDDTLMSLIFRRLAKAISEAYDAPHPTWTEPELDDEPL